MKTFLILGAGTGGTMVANKMSAALDSQEWRIVVVDKDENHYYQPGFLFIPFGIYSPADVVKPKRNFLPPTVDVIFGEIELIDEGYNASPASVGAALRLLGELPPAFGGRRIVVLGDMRELGERGPQLHRELAPTLVAAKVDLAFLVGPLMQGLYDALPAAMRGAHAPASEEMVRTLVAAIRPGDTVLIKGSLGTRMAPLVEAVRALDAAASKHAATGH